MNVFRKREKKERETERETGKMEMDALVKEKEEKDVETLNEKLNQFLQHPKMKGFDAIITEMERLMPGQGIKEMAEQVKSKREQERL